MTKLCVLHSACYLRTTCPLSASFLRHFSLTVAGLRAPLSRFLEGVLYKYPECMNECDFKRDTSQDFDVVKNIYLVKRQEHVTNGTTYCQQSITNATFNVTLSVQSVHY